MNSTSEVSGESRSRHLSCIFCKTNPDYLSSHCADCNAQCGSNCTAAVGCVNGSTRSCYTGPPGTAGVGICLAGMQICSGGVWGPCTGQTLPASEVCTGGIDEDCDGSADCFDFSCASYPACSATPYYCDLDGDGHFSPIVTCFGAVCSTYSSCRSTPGDDCDDANPLRHPGAVENCTGGIDEDCDLDADCADFDCRMNASCASQNYYCDRDNDTHYSIAMSCAGSGCSSGNCRGRAGDDCDDSDPMRYPGLAEICDGKDNNCDGVVDSPNPCSGSGVCVSNTCINCTIGPACDTMYVWEGHTYIRNCSLVDWGTAKTYCDSQGAKLATINSAGENECLKRALTDYTWMGFNDIASEGTWVWDSGEPVTFTKWQSGEPNNMGTENCGQWDKGYSYNWNDFPCTRSLNYVCEFNSVIGPPCPASCTDLKSKIETDCSADYTLNCNLDCTGETGLTPICPGGYSGNFDGGDHTITGLNINLPGSDNVGLFAQTSLATIRNIELVNANVIGGNQVGALVGSSISSLIDNSRSTGGSVSGTSDVGGLIGHNGPASTVSSSYSTASVSGTGDNIGGLIGYSYRSAISGSHSTGAVSGSGWNTGGFVGLLDSSGVTNSYSTGDVSGFGYTGGFIGWGSSGGSGENEIKDSYSAGRVSSSTGNLGGFIGGNMAYTVTSCVWYDQYGLNPPVNCCGGGVCGDCTIIPASPP